MRYAINPALVRCERRALMLVVADARNQITGTL
jgi:hypothetical protein